MSGNRKRLTNMDNLARIEIPKDWTPEILKLAEYAKTLGLTFEGFSELPTLEFLGLRGWRDFVLKFSDAPPIPNEPLPCFNCGGAVEFKEEEYVVGSGKRFGVECGCPKCNVWRGALSYENNLEEAKRLSIIAWNQLIRVKNSMKEAGR